MLPLLLVGSGSSVFAQPADASSPEITPLTAADLSRELAARRGKVVVLNMWATWCGPCLEEFPYLVTFAGEASSEHLAVMAISSDIARDIESQVKPFIAAQAPPFPIFLQSDTDDNFFPAVDPEWTGAFPHTVIFSPTGEIVGRLEQFDSAEELRAAVEPHLNQAAAQP